MPLHDWNEPTGWDGFHDVWIVELLRWVKPRLPEGYRAYIGSSPALTVGAVTERADVAVRHWLPEPPSQPASQQDLPADQDSALDEPDEEIATQTLDPQTALYVVTQGRLVAAVKLISPRNKDRTTARAIYLARYLGYLQEGAHLLIVDVHRRPLTFSFADAIAQELQISQSPCLPPFAVSYRVGEPAPSGGRLLAIWRRSLQIGAPSAQHVVGLDGPRGY